jgi:hypothetical protein
VRVNNPDLSPTTAAVVARLGASLAVVVATLVLGAALLARRAPWPWTRALPWSAAERVAVDGVALALPALLVACTGAVVAWRVAGPPGARGVLAPPGAALATALVCGVAAAGALRAGARRQTGGTGETALVGVGASVAVSLWPALAWVAPVAAAALGALAVRRERAALGAVRWDELRHGVEGDPGWITPA